MVKCSECGFLTLRDRTGLFREVGDHYRLPGRVPALVVHGFHDYPICFAMVYDLMPEVEGAAEHKVGTDWSEIVLGITTKERICPPQDKAYGFIKWQQGFTPKEHREMLDRLEWLKWQERQRKDDRRWRIIELIVLGIVAALLAGAFTILGAFIERGSLFP